MSLNKCFLDNITTAGVTHRRCITLSFLLFTLIFYLFSFAEVNATIRYVSKTGLSIPPYTSWETAADSIQKCINICVFGDTIYVANGVYKEQVVMIPGLALIGSGTDSCIVDSRGFPPQGLHTIKVANNCLLKGFYIRTSNDFNYGYGIYTTGVNGLITENKISEANSGIAIWQTNITAYKNYCFNVRRGISVFNSNSIVRKNEIFILTPTGGVSCIYITAFSDSYQPIIDSNYIETKGDGIYKSIGARPIIKNNVIIISGGGSEGIRVSSSDSTKVYNNLIIAINGFEASDGINNYGVEYLSSYNNVITGDYYYYVLLLRSNDTAINNLIIKADGWIPAYTGGNLQYKYNNVWDSNIAFGFTPDSTNLSVDPMVVNDDITQGDLDFHLQAYSPLIDAGDPTILDKDGSRSDIGLYGGPYGESYVYVDLSPRSPVNLTASVDSSIVTLKWNKNTEADFSYYKLFYDTTKNFQVDSTKLISSQPDTFYYFVIPPEADSIYFKLTAVDNQGNESSPSEEAGVIVTSVKDEWKPVNNYILYQNYPNPFNPSTKIGYKLRERGYVKLYVYDIKGELISVLVNEVQEAGYYEVEFGESVGSGSASGGAVGKSLASGVYIYQIFVKGENNIPVFSDIKKMMYVK